MSGGMSKSISWSNEKDISFRIMQNKKVYPFEIINTLKGYTLLDNMKPKCKKCKRAGVRLSSRIRLKDGKRSSEASPYYMCPECGEIVNIKCNSGKIKIVKSKSVEPEANELEIDWDD